jgi:hypothetical protein
MFLEEMKPLLFTYVEKTLGQISPKRVCNQGV